MKLGFAHEGTPLVEDQPISSTVFAAILWCLLGALALALRLNKWTAGGVCVVTGLGLGFDAVLALRGVPARKRLWLRISFFFAGVLVVALLWYLGVR